MGTAPARLSQFECDLDRYIVWLAGSGRQKGVAINLEDYLGMPREVISQDGITWTCLQAYAGLDDEKASEAAVRAAGGDGCLTVICTPSGGAQSVRLELPPDWETAYGDEELLREIQARREK
jgi:hypothetical protein